MKTARSVPSGPADIRRAAFWLMSAGNHWETSLPRRNGLDRILQ
jgi:hypothetical protein